MTHKPDDNRDLVKFLKQNQPIPPPAAFDLERRIMTSLTPRRQHLWVVPTAIVAGALTTFLGYRLLQPAQYKAQNPEEIEEFIESNWSSSIQGTSASTTDPTAEYLALVEPTTGN